MSNQQQQQELSNNENVVSTPSTSSTSSTSNVNNQLTLSNEVKKPSLENEIIQPFRPSFFTENNKGDVASIKKSLSEMEQYIEKSKVPLHKQSPEFKKAWFKLEEQKEQAMNDVYNNLKLLHEEFGLPSDIAQDYKDLHNENDFTKIRPIATYVACSTAAYNSVKRDRDQYQEKFKLTEAERDKWAQQNDQLSKEIEELRDLKRSKSYNSSSSYSSSSSIKEEKRDSDGRYNLLSAFDNKSVGRTKPDAWLSNYIYPSGDDIYTKPASYSTDQQGVNHLKTLGAYMSQHSANPTLHSSYGGNFAQYQH